MELYPVTLKVGSGLAGAPTLTIGALVNASTGAMTGHAEITQALAPPYGQLEINDLAGRVVTFPMPPNPMKSVSLLGHYLYPFPPPAIGEVRMTLEVHLLVDAQWNGHGSFIYGGHRIDNVPVKNISPRV